MSRRDYTSIPSSHANSQYGPEGQTSKRMNPVRILALGPIGAGKSSFVAAAVEPGYKVVVSDEAESCTQVCQEYPTIYTFGGNKVMLIDTPGFEDPARDNVDILKEITKHVEGVSGIIYFHRCTDTRLEGEVKLNFEIIKAMCGPEFYSRIVICSTCWDITQPAKHTGRMESMLNDPEAFGEVMRGGAEYREFWRNDKDPCLDVLRHFASQRNAPPMAIVEQLARNNGQIKETTAGCIVEDKKKKKKRSSRTGPGSSEAKSSEVGWMSQLRAKGSR